MFNLNPTEQRNVVLTLLRKVGCPECVFGFPYQIIVFVSGSNLLSKSWPVVPGTPIFIKIIKSLVPVGDTYPVFQLPVPILGTGFPWYKKWISSLEYSEPLLKLKGLRLSNSALKSIQR